MSFMTDFGIFPLVRRHVRLPSRSASPATSSRLHTTGQFLHRGELLQHVFLVVIGFAIPVIPRASDGGGRRGRRLAARADAPHDHLGVVGHEAGEPCGVQQR